MSMESGARIVRAAKNTGYTKVNNEAIADDRLSWEAAGLLAYLLTKPDNWVVRQGHLIAMRKGARERMMRMFRELRLAGYLHLHREQGEGGRLSGSYYVLFEEANEPDPSLADSPVSRPSGFPTVGKADPLVRTEVPTRTDKPEDTHAPSPTETTHGGRPAARPAARKVDPEAAKLYGDLFVAVRDAVGMAGQPVVGKDAAQISAAAKNLVRVHATPEEVAGALRRWWLDDWRGEGGQHPTPSQLVTFITQLRAKAAKRAAEPVVDGGLRF